jgi:hypothetical protein
MICTIREVMTIYTYKTVVFSKDSATSSTNIFKTTSTLHINTLPITIQSSLLTPIKSHYIPSTTTNEHHHLKMNFLFFITLLPFALVSAVPTKDPYPAPCGRSDPSGICTTKDTCYKKGGFYVQRDCTFYNVLDIGCCYNIPDKK